MLTHCPNHSCLRTMADGHDLGSLHPRQPNATFTTGQRVRQTPPKGRLPGGGRRIRTTGPSRVEYLCFDWFCQLEVEEACSEKPPVLGGDRQFESVFLRRGVSPITRTVEGYDAAHPRRQCRAKLAEPADNRCRVSPRHRRPADASGGH
jgi:hypothetical protein